MLEGYSVPNYTISGNHTFVYKPVQTKLLFASGILHVASVRTRMSGWRTAIALLDADLSWRQQMIPFAWISGLAFAGADINMISPICLI